MFLLFDSFLSADAARRLECCDRSIVRFIIDCQIRGIHTYDTQEGPKCLQFECRTVSGYYVLHNDLQESTKNYLGLSSRIFISLIRPANQSGARKMCLSPENASPSPPIQNPIARIKPLERICDCDLKQSSEEPASSW